MSRIIYLITHGQKAKGPNPGLSENGQKQIRSLRLRLPRNIHSVVCGVGQRHLETAECLQLEPDRYSGIVGVAESKNRNSNTVYLANGAEIPYDKYSGVADRAQAFMALLMMLPARTLVVTSRPMIKVLNPEANGQEATLYSFKPDTRELKEIFSVSNNVGDNTQEV